jgi:hypothetical protein
MHGAQRVHPVAEGALVAVGVTKRDALCYHLQVNTLGSKPSSHTTSVSRGVSELGLELPRSSSASRWLHARLGWPVAKPRACGGVRGLSMSTRRGHLETRGVARGDATVHNVPCKRNHSPTAGSHTRSLHGDGGLGSMGGSRAPHGRGAAVLRLEGASQGSTRAKGLHPGLPQAGLAMWPAPNGRHRARRVISMGKRGFPPSDSPWGGSWVRASSACAPARRPDRPIHARPATARVGRCGAVCQWGKR